MSQSHRSEAALASAPVGPLMFKLALPAVAAQLINMLYNIVDRIYIGHIPEVGRAALTGLGVTFLAPTELRPKGWHLSSSPYLQYQFKRRL